MARIVLGLGTSHSPMLSTTPDIWPQHVERDLRNKALWGIDGQTHDYEELLSLADPSIAKEVSPEKWQTRYDACQKAIAGVGEILAKAAPDVLLMIGDDQKEVFNEDNMPAMLVYWGDNFMSIPRDRSRMPPSIAAAAWANEFEAERAFPVATSMGQHIIESLIDQDFDVAHSRHFAPGRGMGHAFGFVYRRIMDGKAMPVIPVMLNTYYPPNQPTPGRSYNLGKALRQAIESWDEDLRVGVVASGGLSHFVVDEELDDGVIKALREKDEAHLRALPRNRLNSGTSETRNWIAAAGALEELDMELIDYVPCYRSPAGTGCAMAFAYWQ